VFSLNSWIAIIIKNMLVSCGTAQRRPLVVLILRLLTAVGEMTPCPCSSCCHHYAARTVLQAGTVLVDSTSSGGTSRVNSLHATLLSAIPYTTAALAMWAVACSSHHFKEKPLHVGVPWVVGGMELTFFEPVFRAAFAGGFVIITIALTLAYSSQNVCFARVTGGCALNGAGRGVAVACLQNTKQSMSPVCAAESLDRKHAGVGVAIFNSVGAAEGGFIGPLVVGGE
jgi:hypothetical protein